MRDLHRNPEPWHGQGPPQPSGVGAVKSQQGCGPRGCFSHFLPSLGLSFPTYRMCGQLAYLQGHFQIQ